MMKSVLGVVLFASVLTLFPVVQAEELKPRIVVLTDIAPNDVEPDDMESTIRLLAHADLFEIEALVATTGWSNNGGSERIDLIRDALNAYEKDLPNLLKRSSQTGHRADESRQEIGYWPSLDYLRSRTMLGSVKMGQRFVGEGNDSEGSNLIIKLADEDDERPIWVCVWGGGNTVAQAIWRVQKDRTPEQLRAFLKKIRVYTITDQDKPWGAQVDFAISSHQWMRREFQDDLLFIWDESAWLFQNDTGKSNWERYAELIQGHGALGALYPKYKWGVEGDTPSFLYVWPNGLNDPEHPGFGGWGGYFEKMTGPDKKTDAFTNFEGTPARAVSRKYETRFYPAIFNNFAARMDWAANGTGNRNPVAVVNGDQSLKILTLKPNAGESVVLDASASSDPDGDALTFSWWVLTEAGTYTQAIEIEGKDSNTATVKVPVAAAGKSFHVVCEVTDNGTPALTSYRRIVFEPEASAEVVQSVDARHVRLLPGSAFYDRQEIHRETYLASYEPDRLLYDYRRQAGVPSADKLAIRYASVDVGTISVVVNDQPVRKVNVHSSGSLTNSFLYAVVDVEIPADSVLTIRMDAGDVPVNVDQVIVGKGDLGLPPDIWNLPALEVAEGPYTADWEEIGQRYAVPEWWREAKFGAWSHWDPQSMPEQGDWYARGMYMPGNGQYDYHLKNFGHPSEYGYKDICNNWVVDRWDPEELMELYVEMGARYFMAMGVHHDNFDCYDSTYQPWNSVNVGPKVDVVGIWEKVARKNGLRFGIGFHNTPGRTWGQFMTVRYTSDRTGPKQGVPYDAMQTILDGNGKWWEGMDPVDLYGPEHDKSDPLRSPYANQFMWRVDDAITKYHPDIIYFDEHAGNSQMDLGVRMGLGFLAPQLIANYYNKSLEWNDGKMEAVLNLKGVGGRYDSFQNTPELLPHVDRAIVKSTEAVIEPEIMAYSFQTETTVAPWHYQAGQNYMDAKEIVRLLMENVCRNGTMLLNLTQHGRGELDPELVQIAKDIGAWLKVNGEAVYGSRPFEVYGEGSVRYTRNDGQVYATLMDWNGGPITLKALKRNGATLGSVSKVELLGSDVALAFVQSDQGLTVTPDGTVKPLSGMNDQPLAAGCRVLRITHDKGWYNDDDQGATYPGWMRTCNLNSGDFNNDLTTSDTPGAVWSSSFTGTSVTVVAPKEAEAGSIEIQIDGQTRETVDFSTNGPRLPQQKVCEVTGLVPGQHTIRIIHRGAGPVAVDALIVK